MCSLPIHKSNQIKILLIHRLKYDIRLLVLVHTCTCTYILQLTRHVRVHTSTHKMQQASVQSSVYAWLLQIILLYITYKYIESVQIPILGLGTACSLVPWSTYHIASALMPVFGRIQRCLPQSFRQSETHLSVSSLVARMAFFSTWPA